MNSDQILGIVENGAFFRLGIPGYVGAGRNLSAPSRALNVEAQEGLPKHLLFSQSPIGAAKSQVSAAIAARLSMTTGRIIPELRSLPGKWICRTEPIQPVAAKFQTMNIWN